MSNKLGFVILTVFKNEDEVATYLSNSGHVVTTYNRADGYVEVTTWNELGAARLVANMARRGYEFDVNGVGTKAVGA